MYLLYAVSVKAREKAVALGMEPGSSGINTNVLNC